MAATDQPTSPPPRDSSRREGREEEGVGRENVRANCLFMLIARVKRKGSVRVCVRFGGLCVISWRGPYFSSLFQTQEVPTHCTTRLPDSLAKETKQFAL